MKSLKSIKRELRKNIAKPLLFSFFYYLSATAFGQLNVSTAMSPSQLVQNVLVGTGVTVSNVTYSGAAGTIGDFTTGSNPTNLGISSGIIMSSGVVDASNSQYPIGSPSSNFNSWTNGTGSDPQLASLVSSTLYDATTLEFDFIPLADTIKFRYVFGSEEYPEYVGSSYNDVFAFFVSGPNPAGGNYTNQNIALIPGTATPVTINNVNIGSYAQYYVDNTVGMTIVYDGFTTVLTAWCLVVPCQTYHIKIGIADAGDSAFDSAVFLEANSFSTNYLNVTTTYTTNLDTAAIEGCSDAIVSFILQNPATLPVVINYTISGTATNGTDYTTLPTSVTIPPGQDSAAIIIAAIYDGITEGSESVIFNIQTSICGGNQNYTVWITDNTPVIATAWGDTSTCGGPATLYSSASGGIGPYAFQWDNGGGINDTAIVSPTVTTTYIVSVTDACGATSTDDATVNVGAIPVASFVISPQLVCIAENATITFTGTAPPGANYTWNFDGGTATGSGQGPYQVNWATSGTKIISLIVIDNGCPSLIYFDSLTVVSMPIALFYATNTSGCAPLTVSFQDSSVNAPSSTIYYWDFGDQNSSTMQNPTHTYLLPGTYDVTLSISSGNLCVSTYTIPMLVNAYASPNAEFVTNPQLVSILDPLVFFQDLSTGSPTPITWDWTLGDGTLQSIQNFTHAYSDTGTYLVTLVVHDINGCSDSAYNYVYVNYYYTIYVPSAFSPNDDNNNDYFLAYGVNLLDFNMKIFNRWGEKLFETSDIKEGWDGTYKGLEAPLGEYVYMINYTDVLHKKHKVFGHVALLRKNSINN